MLCRHYVCRYFAMIIIFAAACRDDGARVASGARGARFASECAVDAFLCAMQATRARACAARCRLLHFALMPRVYVALIYALCYAISPPQLFASCHIDCAHAAMRPAPAPCCAAARRGMPRGSAPLMRGVCQTCRKVAPFSAAICCGSGKRARRSSCQEAYKG